MASWALFSGFWASVLHAWGFQVLWGLNNRGLPEYPLYRALQRQNCKLVWLPFLALMKSLNVYSVVVGEQSCRSFWLKRLVGEESLLSHRKRGHHNTRGHLQVGSLQIEKTLYSSRSLLVLGAVWQPSGRLPTYKLRTFKRL